MPVSLRLLKGILYAALLTPLLVWGIFLFPFITSKTLYFRFLVEAALLLYLPLAYRYRELRPKFDAVSIAVLGYFTALLVSAIFGVDFYRSFWGTVERGEGLVTMLHFVVYFFILSSVLKTEGEWRRYLRFAVISTFVVALYAFAQVLELPLVMSAGGGRISGTIGNAAFFAALMMFGMFLSLYLAARPPAGEAGSKRLPERIFLYLVFFFEMLLLYKSASRGAILATALAFFGYLVYKVFSSRSRRAKVTAGILAAGLLLGAGALYLNRDSAFVHGNSTLLRFATISAEDVTTQSRLDTWQASLTSWKERPFFGYGYENYNIAFNKYFPARIFKKPGSQIWFDRAHNIVFDVAVASGLVGLLAYLSIFAAAAWRLIRRRGESVILLFALGAYFIQNLFVFDTQATYLFFYIILARIVYLGRAPKQIQAFAKRKAWPIAIPLAVVLAIFSYFVNMQPLLANYHGTQALKAALGGLLAEGEAHFKKALSYGTYMDAELRQHFAEAALAANVANLFKMIATEFRKSIIEAPLDVKNYLYLMNVLNHMPNESGSFEEVLVLADRARALSPTRPQIYSELGQAYFFRKEFALGLENFRKSVELSPEPYVSHFNFLLAGIIGSAPDVVAEQSRIIAEQYKHVFSADEYVQLAKAYQSAGKLDEALKNYRAAVAAEPQRTDLRANLVIFYGEQCNLEAVRSEINEIIRINRAYQSEAVTFLSQVEKNCKK